MTLGLERGDRVGIWSPNTSEWTLAQFATAKAGLVLVNVNPAYRRSELEYAMNKVECKALILAPALKTSNYLEIVDDLVKARKLPHLEHIVRLGKDKTPGMLNFDDVASAGGNAERVKLAELRAQAAVRRCDQHPVHLSGTTGLPKGATLIAPQHPQQRLLRRRGAGAHRGDRLCIPVPLYHCFGMVMGNLGCVDARRDHGLSRRRRSIRWRSSKRSRPKRCTALYGVPTMFIAELEHPDFDTFDLSTLRTGIMAGSPCPIEVMRRVIDRHAHARGRHRLRHDRDQPGELPDRARRSARAARLDRRPGAAASRGEDRRCARAASCRAATPGELCTRGYSVMIGYWDDPEKTREAIDADGWMHTGDLATIDDEGYCNIVGRIKDMVIRGGENVYPREIEEYPLPPSQDRGRAGDRRARSEVRRGDLRLDQAARGRRARRGEEIIDFCKGQIAHYKIPRYVKFVDDFPMTVTGKIQKFEMRKAMIAELGLAEQKTA